MLCYRLPYSVKCFSSRYRQRSFPVTGRRKPSAPFAGGIAGQADGLVERCVNRGDVSNDNSALSSLPVSAAVGGIVGIQETSAGIHHCENSGKISNYYGNNLASFADKLYVVTGGIAGQAAIVNSCVNEKSAEVLGAVLSGSNPTTRNTHLLQVGGIVGYHLKGTVKECKNAGTVRSEATANSFCGGIAGFDKGGAIALCANRGTVNSTGRGGGIAGRTMSSSVDQCYHSGAVTAASYGGGLVAHAEGGSYTNNFSAGSHTGNYNAGLIGTIAGSVTLKGCYSAPKSITALTAVIRAGSAAAKENNYFVKAAKESDATGAATEVTAEQLSNAEAPLAGFGNTEIWIFDAENGYAFPQLVNNPYEG